MHIQLHGCAYPHCRVRADHPTVPHHFAALDRSNHDVVCRLRRASGWVEKLPAEGRLRDSNDGRAWHVLGAQVACRERQSSVWCCTIHTHCLHCRRGQAHHGQARTTSWPRHLSQRSHRSEVATGIHRSLSSGCVCLFGSVRATVLATVHAVIERTLEHCASGYV